MEDECVMSGESARELWKDVGVDSAHKLDSFPKHTRKARCHQSRKAPPMIVMEIKQHSMSSLKTARPQAMQAKIIG